MQGTNEKFTKRKTDISRQLLYPSCVAFDFFLGRQNSYECVNLCTYRTCAHVKKIDENHSEENNSVRQNYARCSKSFARFRNLNLITQCVLFPMKRTR